MEQAFSKHGVASSVDAMMGLWLHHNRFCDWCGVKLLSLDDIAQYREFCVNLKDIWPSRRTRLPVAKVFCDKCARGAIGELVDRVPYDGSVPF